MLNTININSKVPGTQTGQGKSSLRSIFLNYVKNSRKELKQKPCLLEIPRKKGSPAGKKRQYLMSSLKGIEQKKPK